MMTLLRPTPRRGFTLIELLVVLLIVAIISAVALPVVLPALNERKINESARLLQAVLAGARDAAIRANAPRGIRFLIDPVFNDLGVGPLASNRMIPIEPAPDYSEGLVNLKPGPAAGQIQIEEVLYLNYTNDQIRSLGAVPNDAIPSNPTSWSWNVRQGDKIRINNSGPLYTIAGPMRIGLYPNANDNDTGNRTIINSERFINYGRPAAQPARRAVPDYLIVTNGRDDDGDGYTDEAFDGLDNNGDGITDPLFNGLGDGYAKFVTNTFPNDSFESETETFDSSQYTPFGNPANLTYTIYRRPIVSPNARETTLPEGVVIDLTTWDAAAASQVMVSRDTTNPVLRPERSRLPVDPYTGYVDIMLAPTGEVVQGGAGASSAEFSSQAPVSSQPFYHFWLTEREGVSAPLFPIDTSRQPNNTPGLNPNYGSTTTSLNYMLPLPAGTTTGDGTIYSGPPLQGERRLVTLFVKTGQIVSNSLQTFDLRDTSAPFYDAQSGTKEPQ